MAGQGAWSKQDADAVRRRSRSGASNENTPIRGRAGAARVGRAVERGHGARRGPQPQRDLPAADAGARRATARTHCRSRARARGTTSAEAHGAARSKEGRRSRTSAESNGSGRRRHGGRSHASLTRVCRPTYGEARKGGTVVPTWTSSLRLRRKTSQRQHCVVALAYPAAGLAAGGTPMPAPDDPPSTLTPSTRARPGQRFEDARRPRPRDGGVRGPGADARRAARRRTGPRRHAPRHPQRPGARARRRAARRAVDRDIDGAVGHRHHAVPDAFDDDAASAKPTQRAKPRPIPKATAKATDAPSGIAAAKAHGPARPRRASHGTRVRLGLPVGARLARARR